MSEPVTYSVVISMRFRLSGLQSQLQKLRSTLHASGVVPLSNQLIPKPGGYADWVVVIDVADKRAMETWLKEQECQESPSSQPVSA